MPGVKKYVEISSVSSMRDFQSRRMNAKIKNDDKKIFINTYNGSALAIERTIAAIIENYYNVDDKKVSMPTILQKYLSFDKI
jgi:seryl-tRNA synthetase